MRNIYVRKSQTLLNTITQKYLITGQCYSKALSEISNKTCTVRFNDKSQNVTYGEVMDIYFL